jgi:hypothetical protein
MAPIKATKGATAEKSKRETKGKKSKKASTPPPPGEPRYDENDDLIAGSQFGSTASGSGLLMDERGGGDERAGRHGQFEPTASGSGLQTERGGGDERAGESESTSDNDGGEVKIVKKGKTRAKKSKKARRRARDTSSSSSDDSARSRSRSHKRSKRHRRRSPSSSSSSSSSDTEDSEWEDYFSHEAVVHIREKLEVGMPKPPHEVAKGQRSFAFDGTGEVLFVRRPAGRREKWMKESRSERSERYGDYSGALSRIGHNGADRVVRRNIVACLKPLKAVEKALLTSPMSGSVRRGLAEARGILYNRMDLLKIEHETNPTIAGYVEAKRSRGDQKDVDMAVEKYARAGGDGGVRGGGGRGNRRRQSYNIGRSPPFVPAHPPPFPAYPPPAQRPQGYGGFGGVGGPRQGSGTRAPPGTCYDCHENGHHRGDAACKGKK